LASDGRPRRLRATSRRRWIGSRRGQATSGSSGNGRGSPDQPPASRRRRSLVRPPCGRVRSVTTTGQGQQTLNPESFSSFFTSGSAREGWAVSRRCPRRSGWGFGHRRDHRVRIGPRRRLRSKRAADVGLGASRDRARDNRAARAHPPKRAADWSSLDDTKPAAWATVCISCPDVTNAVSAGDLVVERAEEIEVVVRHVSWLSQHHRSSRSCRLSGLRRVRRFGLRRRCRC
jgi:hypothetical protein